MDEKVKRLISKLLNLNHAEIEMKTASNPGDNWTGSVYRIGVKGYDKLKKQTQLALFIKIAASDVSCRKLSYVVPLYQREIYFYKNVIPELIAIQQEKNTEKLFLPFPNYYASSLNYLEECILTEDLQEKKFIIGKYQQPVDYSSALLVMKNLGRLHALSCAIKNNKPDVYKKLVPNLKNNVFSLPTVAEIATKLVVNLSNQIISNCEVNDAPLAKSLQEFSEKFPLLYTSTGLLQESSKYDVICHGDCVLRNTMFKYGTGSRFETPEECYMIDLQMARIASPAYDLLYFLFVSTDKNFRAVHYDNMIEEYYKSFSTFLTELGGDPEESLPFDVLQQHLKLFAPFGLYAAMYNNISLHHKSANEVLEQDGLSEKPIEENFILINDNRYFIRMKDLISDMINYGYTFSWQGIPQTQV